MFLGKSIFSTVLGDTEYEWKIKPLYQLAQNGILPLVRFEIPDSFQDEWYWGESTVQEHIMATLKADYSFPIIVWDGQVIDGAHRCCLSLSAGVNRIDAYVIDSMPPHEREYIPNGKHRIPNGKKLSHKLVIQKVQQLMEKYQDTPKPQKITFAKHLYEN
tara:strand:+ start:1658 stop:2137 length:480 start_codon:yes stop_codon:yes gene_type:complete